MPPSQYTEVNSCSHSHHVNNIALYHDRSVHNDCAAYGKQHVQALASKILPIIQFFIDIQYLTGTVCIARTTKLCLRNFVHASVATSLIAAQNVYPKSKGVPVMTSALASSEPVTL